MRERGQVIPGALRKSIVYGKFLVGKVGNNFSADGKGKYD